MQSHRNVWEIHRWICCLSGNWKLKGQWGLTDSLLKTQKFTFIFQERKRTKYSRRTWPQPVVYSKIIVLVLRTWRTRPFHHTELSRDIVRKTETKTRRINIEYHINIVRYMHVWKDKLWHHWVESNYIYLLLKRKLRVTEINESSRHTGNPPYLLSYMNWWRHQIVLEGRKTLINLEKKGIFRLMMIVIMIKMELCISLFRSVL